MDLHLPNATRPFTRQEMDAAVSLRPSALVALVYGRGVVPEARDQIAELVRQTGARLILRPYDHQIITRWEAEHWGRECARRVEEYLSVSADITAILDNEPNLPEEGGVSDPWQLWLFWTQAAAAFREVLGRRVKLALPPLAPVGDYLDIYRWILDWGVPGHFDRVALHVYARTGNWADVAWMRERTGLAVDVTEWDSWTDRGYMPTWDCLRRLEGADARAWFILASDDPQFDPLHLMKHWEEIMGTWTEGAQSVEAQLQQLLDQNAAIYNALKLVLQGRWQGEMPHAEAFTKSLNPDEAGSWSAVPFPGSKS